MNGTTYNLKHIHTRTHTNENTHRYTHALACTDERTFYPLLLERKFWFQLKIRASNERQVVWEHVKFCVRTEVELLRAEQCQPSIWPARCSDSLLRGYRTWILSFIPKNQIKKVENPLPIGYRMNLLRSFTLSFALFICRLWTWLYRLFLRDLIWTQPVDWLHEMLLVLIKWKV